ncbi:MAG TPA: cytochrome b/b6 domain-containing protein [Bosea sp. (in: a-proteobacteria)]|jgi:cytochrome b561|nr:cytochrome b/b6 domain-containing protein [Bosea sp. (in: a-proteobacteria)]
MSMAIPESEVRADGKPSLPILAQVLHWLTAALVLGLFATGVMMKQLGEGPAADLLYLCHKTIGAALLGLVLIRIIYRLFAHLTARWQKGAASRPVHALLYLSLLVVPLLGWAGVSAFGARQLLFGLSLPEIWAPETGHAELLLSSHAWLAFGLIALVVVHIGVALGDYLTPDAKAD